jgi:SPP1 family predicted phage head-tail adaptor
MRYGRLDRRITIQRKIVTSSPSGQPIETWVDLDPRRWASVNPVSGDERFTEPQLAGKQQTEFQVRYSADVASLTPLDRIVYPAIEPASPPPEIPPATIYDVLAVHEVGRREGLRIITSRRADA